MERRTYFLFFIGQRSSVADRGGLSFQGFPIIDFQFLFHLIFIILFNFYLIFKFLFNFYIFI